MKCKRAIVTGANGFVGHHLVQQLAEAGYSVVSVVRNREENIDNIKNLHTHIVYCDLKEINRLPEQCPDMENALFFHLAWAGSSGDARGDYRLQMKNALYTVDALKAAKKIGCRKVIAAGSVTQLMYRDFVHQDGVQPEITVCYAIGKETAEMMCKCVSTEVKMDFSWTYISNFYGADDPTQNFINFLIENYTSGKVPTLTSAKQMADFMYVSDVARALVAIGEKGQKNTSYYVGYGSPKPLEYFIQKVHDMISPDLPTGIGLKEFQGETVDYTKIDHKKLFRDTGFEPMITFEEGIGQCLGKVNR